LVADLIVLAILMSTTSVRLSFEAMVAQVNAVDPVEFVAGASLFFAL